MITPAYLEYAIKELIKDYEYDKKIRKMERSKIRRAKLKIKQIIARIKKNKIFNQKWDFINKNWVVNKFRRKKPNLAKQPVTNNQKQQVRTTNYPNQSVRTTNR